MSASVSTVALAARPCSSVSRLANSSRPIRTPTLRRTRAPVVVRAAEGGGMDTQEITKKAEKTAEELKKKWEATEEKPAAIALTVAGFVAVWASAGVVSAVDSLPVIGDLFELIGLFVTGWFVYRYLIFGPDRAELKQKIDAFLKQVAGK
mmetsp:Transcript_16984/g.40521  ORF Transcript_16984/g.40521 Transcript_16984/m.40521 type:complete len:150 (-) Transcript_16984:57-506(-)